MHSEFVNINAVPTRVTCWGKWIEESFGEDDCKHIILMIIGNPGVTSYYHTFLDMVHQRTGYNVWVLSHAGHEYPQLPSASKMSSGDKKHPLYSLQEQVDAKIQFVREYVPCDCHLHLVGHSIGAYMCCQLLKESDLNKIITKSYLLFPTIERMATSPNGRFYTGVVQRIQYLLLFLATIFSYFPNFIQLLLVQMFFCLMGFSSDCCQSTMTLLKPEVLRNVFYLADDEMICVQERDSAVVEHKDKLLVYYGARDGWAPTKYCRDLRKDAPGIKAVIDRHGYQHAYVLKYSTEVALLLSDWILEN